MIDLKSVARSCGFTVAYSMNPATLEFLPEVRDMCSADRCQSYNRSWSCPPACGELEFWKEKASHYSHGLILQTIGDREDSYDIEAMTEVAEQCRKNGDALVDRLYDCGIDFLFFSAGTCRRCENCTYPDAPCRFPKKLFPSMEACGLFVSKVCKDHGVPYYYGDQKIAYTCCLLYNE